jgi:hypothetical protein
LISDFDFFCISFLSNANVPRIGESSDSRPSL